MTALALRLLTGRAGGYVLAGVLALGAWGAWTLRGHQLATARADVARLTAEGAVLSRDILAQNAAVADLEAQAAAQARRVSQAAADAATARAQADARVRRILAAQVPTDCTGAVAWGAAQAGELVRRWTP